MDRAFPTQCIGFAADVNVEFSPAVEKVQVPDQPKCCALVMLGWRTGERKNFLSEAKEQNMPKILAVGARDQERLIGEFSPVVVVGSRADLKGARGDDEKCGLKGLSPAPGSPGCVAAMAGVPAWSPPHMEAASPLGASAKYCSNRPVGFRVGG